MIETDLPAALALIGAKVRSLRESSLPHVGEGQAATDSSSPIVGEGRGGG